MVFFCLMLTCSTIMFITGKDIRCLILQAKIMGTHGIGVLTILLRFPLPKRDSCASMVFATVTGPSLPTLQ